ncbi:MAG: hypothetical protein ACUVTD_06120 [Nitrososphaerales archaeon]
MKSEGPIDAEEASMRVKDFLEKIGGTIFVVPQSAERRDGIWYLRFIVGFQSMWFEVESQTGRILRYGVIE